MPLANLTDLDNQYAAFGITMENLYHYHDARDTFDALGASLDNRGTVGNVFFTGGTSSLAIDYFVIRNRTGSYRAYDAANNLLDTLIVAAGAADVLGSYTFAAGTIARLELGGDPGFTQVSTLNFDGTVPEPSTLGLLAAGVAAVAIRKFRKA